MIKKASNNEVKIEKLNLIPIMDAVFIFIFFLLFSAQFIKIYDIESDAPVVSEVPPSQVEEKPPLNLKVKITPDEYVITKGFNDIIIKKIPNFDNEESLKNLKDYVFNIRKKNPDDNYIIIAPEETIQYDLIAKVMDTVKSLPKGTSTLELEVKGRKVEYSEIFKQVVLEPIE